ENHGAHGRGRAQDADGRLAGGHSGGPRGCLLGRPAPGQRTRPPHTGDRPRGGGRAAAGGPPGEGIVLDIRGRRGRAEHRHRLLLLALPRRGSGRRGRGYAHQGLRGPATRGLRARGLPEGRREGQARRGEAAAERLLRTGSPGRADGGLGRGLRPEAPGSPLLPRGQGTLAGRGGLRRAAVRPLGLPREDQGRPV
ncbi:MAG: hypothetical protein AVDCRST_MAG05-2141, partial [uncultured Rubrobacteraceae bacterium]